jgi:hypothetical protein
MKKGKRYSCTDMRPLALQLKLPLTVITLELMMKTSLLVTITDPVIIAAIGVGKLMVFPVLKVEKAEKIKSMGKL